MLKIIQKSRLSKLPLIKFVPPNYSTKPAVQEKKHFDDQIREFEKISKISQKVKTKKPQKPPFVKNLLLGIFDTDILTYPELQNEELKNLKQNLEEAKNVLEQPEIKECNQLSQQLKKLANARILGLQASQLFGGRELNATETCRLLEAISEISSKHVIVNNESLGIQTLVKFGNDRLKQKYLQRLINGESLTAFCLLEPLSSNIDVLKRTATLSSDGKTWVLNGEKRMVINGSNADLFVVIAHTNSVMKDEVGGQKFTAFLVERDFGGVTSTRHGTVDPNLEVSDIIFENTQIPIENVIGKEEMGESVLSGIYPEYRLSTGPVCIALVKNLINKMTAHFIKISREPYLLHETDAIRSKMGELTTSLYAIESMVYLTTGLLDNYENQDCELESSIVKIFASEQALLSTSSCIDLIGAEAALENHWCSQFHKEALCHVAVNDANDHLKTTIALFGLSHAGRKMNELIKKLRNPLYYGTFVFKRMWTNRKQADDNPKLNLYLHHYLHPSLINVSQQLEYCVLRLQYATEIFLSRYGQDIIKQHMELRRLGECLMDIYAMTACIGRASRAYCIGLQHAEYEMVLATSFTLSAVERVRSRLLKIIDGPYQTNDENYRKISERLFRLKKYYPVHPLTRNF
ncbi:acyl-CoA dehydrogenase family member 9, mitochondrial [Asbolus verrucosus]|uniref:Acyl-CoA dehydrogenase family member 9, mitochondrial n=1 Tax=Asbolus verrucosus TaxID=1661398 RepID=A0A482VLB9_ASBVE|nr:acyl-CoA dehydrogenase family member 9, mitochondrial [Asbolus verrucosus]